MWFCIGFASFLALFALLRYFATRPVWKGGLSAVREGPHGTRLQPIRGGRSRPVTGVRVIAPIAEDFAFEFTKETATDRIAKAFGISQEWQTGDAAFDSAVYISSDDARVCELLRQDAHVRRAVFDLTQGADGNAFLGDWGNPGVFCRGGEIWLQYTGRPGLGEAEAWQIGEFAAPRLFALVTGLARIANGPLRDSRDVFVTRAWNFYALCGALSFGSIFHLVVIAALPLPLVSDPWALWHHTWHLAVVAIIALLGAAVFQLGRSARTHRVLLWTFFIGGLGTLGASWSLLWEANIAFDHGEGQQITRRVESMQERHGRSHHWEIYVADWGREGGTRKIEVSRTLFQTLRPGVQVELTERPGALGVPWVSAIVRAP